MKHPIIWGLVLVLALVIWGIRPRYPIGVSRERDLTHLRMNILAEALEAYKKQYVDYPEGDAARMFAVLLNQTDGIQNPKRTLFFQPRDKEIDSEGRLLDGWGHPFRISYDKQKGELQIVSAGKNGRFDGRRGDMVLRKDLSR